MGKLHCHNTPVFVNRGSYLFQAVDRCIGTDAHLPGAGLSLSCHMGMAGNNKPDAAADKRFHTCRQRVGYSSVHCRHCLVGGGSYKTVFYFHTVYPGGFK